MGWGRERNQTFSKYKTRILTLGYISIKKNKSISGIKSRGGERGVLRFISRSAEQIQNLLNSDVALVCCEMDRKNLQEKQSIKISKKK